MEGCTCEVCLLSRANRRQGELIKDLEYRLRTAERQLLAATIQPSRWWWPRRKAKAS